MYERDRLWATGFIWGAVTIIVLGIVTAFAVTGAALDVDAVVPITLTIMLLILVAGYSTSRVWGGAARERTSIQSAGAQTGKAKRVDRRRFERLIERLDDDEIVELESLLLAREEDQVN